MNMFANLQWPSIIAAVVIVIILHMLWRNLA
jgi:hypothetical protein